jgi:hypothetical protein
MKMRIIACAFAVSLLTAACGSSSAPINTSGATQFWRQQVSKHYENGVVAKGDGRGCVKTNPNHWSCTAYVRNAQNSLSSGQDVIGTVTVSGGNMTVNAHRATSRAIQKWFAQTGGGINP